MIIDLLLVFIVRLLFIIGIVSENYYNDKIINFIKNQGVLFVKLAQTLASRNFNNKKQNTLYINDNLLGKLRDLQDKCFYNDNFNFDIPNSKLIAAGSIASVYLIDENNNHKILKVANYKILDKLEKSRKNLELIIKILRLVYGFDLTNVIDSKEFYIYLKNQIDMDKEAKTQMKFYEIFNENNNVHVPYVFNHNQSSILMEYSPGYKIDELILKHPEYENQAIALVYGSILKMLKHNILHGDYHFGNFLFKVINNDLELIILDYGIICNFTDTQTKYLSYVLHPKKNDKTRQEYLSKFITTFGVTIKKENLGKRIDEFLDEILDNKNNKLTSDIYSCLTTLQVLLSYVDNLRDRDNTFYEYLAGYLLENDYI